jgi:hypothetical protein
VTTVTETAWYVYGVVEATAPVDGVDVIRLANLAAVVEPVPLSEFGEAELSRRMEDHRWLIERARDHEEILERVQATTTVVPFRFGAVYRDPAGVRAMLAERGEELTATLERVRGCVEIGVKIWADRKEVEAAQAAQQPAAASGRDYFERLRETREVARETASRLYRLADEAHGRLLRHAVAGVVNPPQPRQFTGRAESMILNGAYLVADGGTGLFAELAQLEAEAPDGVALERSGPWPPHNFVGREGAQ